MKRVAKTQPARGVGASPSPGSGGRLHGLDGLRAVAVGGVIFYHASASWMPGGFLGVDVFFVLSGYLITSLLLADAGRTGSIDFKGFYLRRARRLLPALFLMLMCAVLYASVFARDAVEQLRTDVPAALGYVANWWFIAQSQPYFLGEERAAVLTHLWSLAVEEQFYLVWPLVLWLVVRRWGAGLHGRLLVCGLAVTAAVQSAGWMALLSARDGFPIPNDPSRAYFGTDTHAFGVVLGAALATVWRVRAHPRQADAPATTPPPATTPIVATAPAATTPAAIRPQHTDASALAPATASAPAAAPAAAPIVATAPAATTPAAIRPRQHTAAPALALASRPAITPVATTTTTAAVRWGLDVVGVVALLAVIWSYVNLDEYSTVLYRGGFAVVDVVVLVLIVALTHPAGRLARLLGAQPLRWLGLRSYGVYLWHWPVFMFTRPEVDVPFDGAVNLAIQIALTLGLAELSYRIVEVPIRTRGFRAFFRSFPTGLGRHRPHRRLLPAAGAAVPVALALTGLYVIQSPAPQSFTTLSGGTTQDHDSDPSVAASNASGQPPPLPGPASSGTTSSDPMLDPSWPKTLTVITDSVLLGTKHVLPAALPGWQVDYRGGVSLTLPSANGELQRGRQPVGSVVVVGLGYNSSWQKDRQNYDVWAGRFDQDADEILAALVSLGAKKVVWVTLRETSVDNIPASAHRQLRENSWHFPYVNERLRAFAQRHPEVILADWAAVSNRPGLTFDTIHLRPDGAALMTETVKAAIGVA